MRRTLIFATAILFTACGDDAPAESAALGLNPSQAMVQIAENLRVEAAPEPEIYGLSPAQIMAQLNENLQVEAPEPEYVEVVAEQPEQAEPVERSLRLKHGESIGLVAQWLGIPPQDLAEANQLKLKARLDVGFTLSYFADDMLQAKLERAREQFGEARLAKFLKKRGGLVEVADRRVRRGESLWRIARKARLPMWVVAHYNPGRDLNTLAPGDTIKLPVLAEGLARR